MSPRCHRCGCIETNQRWSQNEDGMDQCESCHRYLGTARSILAAMRSAQAPMHPRATQKYLQGRVSWQSPGTVRAVMADMIRDGLLELTPDLKVVCPRGVTLE